MEDQEHLLQFTSRGVQGLHPAHGCFKAHGLLEAPVGSPIKLDALAVFFLRY